MNDSKHSGRPDLVGTARTGRDGAPRGPRPPRSGGPPGARSGFSDLRRGRWPRAWGRGRAAAALAAAALGWPGPAAAADALVTTNLEMTETGIWFQVGVPPGFTNGLDVFATGDLRGTPYLWRRVASYPAGTKAWFEPYAPDEPYRLLAVGAGGLDTDRDGLSDAEEILVHRSRPEGADTDGDGLPDGWELVMGLDMLTPNPPGEDPDQDGWSNAAELAAGTAPLNTDSDGDGLADGTDPEPLYAPCVQALTYQFALPDVDLPAAPGTLAPVWGASRTVDPHLPPGAVGLQRLALSGYVDDALLVAGRSFGLFTPFPDVFTNVDITGCVSSRQTGVFRLDLYDYSGLGWRSNRVAFHGTGTVTYLAPVSVSWAGLTSVAVAVGNARPLVASVTPPEALSRVTFSLDPTNIAGVAASGLALAVTGRAAGAATLRLNLDGRPCASVPVYVARADATVYQAYRGADTNAVADTEEETPGFLVTPNYDPGSGDPFEAKIVLKPPGVSAGVTRWLRFSEPSKVKLWWPGLAAPVDPGPGDFAVTNPLASSAEFEIHMNGAWTPDTAPVVDYVLKDVGGADLASDRARLLGPVILPIGDSVTFGYRRLKNGTVQSPTFGVPWTFYPGAAEWSGYGDRTHPDYQGYRGYLSANLPGFTWNGEDPKGHGPRHMGYSGGKTYQINGMFDDTDRAFPLGALTSTCYAIVLYYEGYNDVVNGASGSTTYNNWAAGLNTLYGFRSGKGRTLVVGVTLTKMASWYSQYARNSLLTSFNGYVRGHSVAQPFVRYLVADCENVSHDSNDDGLHFLAGGYSRTEQIIRPVILDGLRLQ